MIRLDYIHQDGDVAELAGIAAKIFESKADDERAGAELGWFGVGIDDELGGVGGTAAHLSAIAEAAGAAAASSAIPLTSGVVARLLERSGAVPDLSALCSGDLLVAIPAGDPRRAASGIRVHGSGPEIAARALSGRLLTIGASVPGWIAVPFDDGAHGAGVAFFSPESEGVRTSAEPGVDASRPLVAVELDDARVSSADVVISGRHQIAEMAALFAGMIALDSAGAARSALAMTIEFAAQRKQFGRTIGSFQAYKHRCASAYIELRLAQSAAFRAVRDGDPAQQLSAALEATRDAVAICGDAVQLHGAIGFSWESGIHRFLKRAKANQIMWAQR